MQYINPIELLQLSNLEDLSQFDSNTLKKAKRRLYAEIDLSDDGHLDYYGLKLSKGDCERVIEELSDDEHKEFYLYLVSNRKLNEFLVNGSEDIFQNFKQDSIFKLPEFIKFISPFFAVKLGKFLSNKFETGDVGFIKLVLKTSFFILQKDSTTAYKSTSDILQRRFDKISRIRRNIKDQTSTFSEDDIHEVVILVEENFPAELLNSLPSYFDSQILKIANEINFLNVAIWDNFDNMQVSEDLLKHILTLKIDGLNKPTFQKNYDIVRGKNQQRLEEEKHTPILKKYAGYLIETKNKLQQIESKALSPSLLLTWVNSSISISEINEMPSVLDEIKNQVAFSLRAMSVSVWNSYSNIGVALDLINKANSIQGLQTETRENINAATTQLIELKSKIDVANLVRRTTLPTRPQPQRYVTGSSKSSGSDDNSGCLWLFIAVVVIGIIIAIANSNKSSSSSYNYENSSPSTVQSVPADYSLDTPDSSAALTSSEDYAEPAASEYLGNQLSDGASPLDSCFGKGIYNGNATLTIDNGGNSDAIVCLYSIESGRTIRNEYVQKSSSFTMSNIGQGSYKIRVFYGNDWNPTIDNSCGTKGNFESDVNFSEFDGTEFFEDSERGYTTARITLYTVAGGNASSSSIDQTTFFNN